MKLIDRVDIESWAKKYEGKGFFPYLISKLVYFSTLPDAQINIPSGSAVFLGGWDGIVYSEQQRPYVPAGQSLWEFGTNIKFKPKADADYKKRSEDPLGYDPSQCTYVFVTPMLWAQKEEWRTEKLAENIWKDIWVFDAVDLEQWLDKSSPVALWFARELKKVPSDGTVDAEQFWAEWSIGDAGQIVPKIITSGRENEVNQLCDFLNGSPNIITVQAKTKTEALAFIIAAADCFEENQKQRFFSKTMVVEKEESYRTLYVNYAKTALNLIPKFDDKSLLQAAVSQGHHVMIPVGADYDIHHKTIILPTIGREGQIDGLVEMGLSKEDAERYSKEAGRDINKLRRLLKFIDNRAPWFKNENIREIIPALILGRWNIYNPGDCQILEKLSGLPFDDYMAILHRWRDFEDSPVLQIGNTWRLTSPLDLWNSVSKYITKNDLEILSESFMSVFNDTGNSGETQLISITYSFNPPKRYSIWTQEGLVQTLVMISLHGESIQSVLHTRPQIWVDQVINNLLFDADSDLWRRTNRKLPLIAEASPKSFFKAVQNSLQKNEPEIMGMFRTKADFLGESSSHTGLLWALEGLAWMPEHLFQATDILLKLAELDPGGKLSNRPAKSLADIYRPRYFQTLAPIQERMEILTAAIKRNPKEGWELLRKLMPKSHDMGSTNNKLRWRLFDKNITLDHSLQEATSAYHVILDLMLELFDNSDEKLAVIIEHSAKMTSFEDCEKMLVFIEANYVTIPKNSTLSRNKTRKILYLHRSSPDAYWSLNEEFLIRYQAIYNALEPEDPTAKYKWLFDSYQVNFPQGRLEIDDDKEEADYNSKVLKVRLEALKILSAEIGIDGVLKLADTPESTQILASVLSKAEQTESEIIEIVSTLKNTGSNKKLVSLYIGNKTSLHGLKWLFDLCSKLETMNLDDIDLFTLFSNVDPSEELWNYIANKSESFNETYWLSIGPYFARITTKESIIAINKLLVYKRFKSALRAAYYLKKELPTEMLSTILYKVATEECRDSFLLEPDEITSLFKEIGKREDKNNETLIKLEWHYLTVLNSYASGYKPKLLINELSESPEFFVDVLKWIYMPSDDKNIEPELKSIPKETLQNYALRGFDLLENFKKIPGVRSDNTIDHSVINMWINKVRELAQTADRIEFADKHLGILLAQFSEENKDYWPPDEISQIIERINTTSLKDNFSVTVTNKRGFTSRSPFEGGNIEKNNAAHFQKLADLHKYNHPNLSEIFMKISEDYLNTAGYQDNQAERDRLDH
ncbi:hypothetical protein [Flavobacterium nitrogenifigens]|uniref:Uncharacterized protein n=1 Tax=Flavobacterium nitrogenifigens TaxID=1617283 RepID=A0A521B2R4_9FLAO|nr:hypothetical protein [Flavobacterium nitrogenifigens]KAF2334613.1 hypothetical protein DM397_08045 [Flavobacterium nitrogenifigens]SMO41404.1 hypothetical protein SAMN06265220_101629 [Flavobacterium nitrogenifigens]